MAITRIPTIWQRQETVAPGYERPSNAPTILGVVGAMMALSTMSVLLRVYVRGLMIKNFGWDDGTIVLAFVSLSHFPLYVCPLPSIKETDSSTSDCRRRFDGVSCFRD
jgi:hypothetical protein